MLLLTLRGTPVLYYGDELGDARRRRSRPTACVDPVGLLNDPERPAATARARRCRGAPSRARASRAPGVEPWLPFGELAGVNVAEQKADPDSALHLTRDLIALRRAEEDLRTGSYEQVVVDGGLWAYRRGDGFLVALNLGSDAASLPAEGTIAIGTRRERDGEALARSLLLAPGEGVVLRVAEPEIRQGAPPVSNRVCCAARIWQDAGPMARIGILTGGGDCPGLNAVIRGVVAQGRQAPRPRVRRLPLRLGRRARRRRRVELDARQHTSGILPRGGTILGTSRTNPYKDGADGTALVREAHGAGRASRR